MLGGRIYALVYVALETDHRCDIDDEGIRGRLQVRQCGLAQEENTADGSR